MAWRNWMSKDKEDKKCPDKYEPIKISAKEEVRREVTPAIKSYFEMSLVKDFKTILALHPQMHTHVFDIEWQTLKGNPMCKQIRLMPDLPSSSEILDGFEKQIAKDQFIKPFIRSDYLENMEDEESTSQEKTSEKE